METPILFPISPEEYWQKLSEVMDRLLNEKLNKGGYPAAPPGMTSRPLLSIKEVFMANCQGCHLLAGNVDGPRLQDMIATRSTDWLYRFFADRKQMGKDAFHEKMKNAFNNFECPEFKNLTRGDIVALVYYIEFQQ